MQIRSATAGSSSGVRQLGYPAPRCVHMWRTAIVLLVAAGALTIFVRWLEPRFAFFPSTGENETPRTFGIEYEPLTIETKDGEHLRAWLMSPAAPRARIVYFHGNGGNLSLWSPILVQIVRQGYGVFAVDYRGYGLSTGEPSERGLYRDVDAVLERAWPNPDRTAPIVYWGRSLGTAMAAYAATVKPPDGIVLESGFPDARSVVRSSPPLWLLSFLSSYRFPVARFMMRVQAPALVMHGDRDSVISFALGRALYEAVTGPKEFVTLAGADHNDLLPPDQRAYWRAVGDFVSRLGR